MNEEQIWKDVLSTDTLEAYYKYKSEFPNGKYITQANKRISELQVSSLSIDDYIRQQRAKSEKTYENIVMEGLKNRSFSRGISAVLEKLSENNNFINIKSLYDAYYVTKNDLVNKANIDEEFVDFFTFEQGVNRNPYNIPTVDVKNYKVRDGFTEIYFWGIPSSGKSCIIASLISELKYQNNLSDGKAYMEPKQGCSYVNAIADPFRPDAGSEGVFRLPNSTDSSKFYELPFAYCIEGRDSKKNFVFYDLPGEILKQAAIKFKDGIETPEVDGGEDLVLSVLEKSPGKFLSSKNKKIHVIVVDSFDWTKKIDGERQDTIISNVIGYLKGLKGNSEYHLILSKVDSLVDASKQDKYIKTIQALTTESSDMKKVVAAREEYYSEYKKIAEKFVNENSANIGKEIANKRIHPFSIGKVCFRLYCKYDSTFSIKLWENVFCKKRKWWQFF